jgi:hypothetical protein
MFNLIREKISRQNFISLSLGRLTDSSFEVVPAINFSSVGLVDNNIIEALYYDQHHCDESGNLIAQKKVIRLDNPLAELPILPNYKGDSKFFTIGEELSSYRQFIKESREYLLTMIGQDITLYYKNDDLSISMVSGSLTEVNKSNIFMNDFHELLVKDNKTVRVEILSRPKNHRFISQNGYMFQVTPAIFEKCQMYDGGEVFGIEKVWNFSIPQKMVNVA